MQHLVRQVKVGSQGPQVQGISVLLLDKAQQVAGQKLDSIILGAHKLSKDVIAPLVHRLQTRRGRNGSMVVLPTLTDLDVPALPTCHSTRRREHHFEGAQLFHL